MLGAPIAMSGEVTQILAEVARGAFAMHKKLLTGAGSLDSKLLAYTQICGHICFVGHWGSAPTRLPPEGHQYPANPVAPGFQHQKEDARTVGPVEPKILETSKDAPSSQTHTPLVYNGPHTGVETMGARSQEWQGYGAHAGAA